MAAVQEQVTEALTLILEDESVFQQVVDTVFQNLDSDENGVVQPLELSDYITHCAEDMGLKEVPSKEQIQHVFRHLDLNGDDAVNKEELAVFLRHLFKEQLKQTGDKLRVHNKDVAYQATHKHGHGHGHSHGHSLAGLHRQETYKKHSPRTPRGTHIPK